MNKKYDELLQEVQTLRGQLEESDRRVNELAAHVERIDGFIKSDLSDPEDERPRHLISSIKRLGEIASDVTAASLSAHDAALLKELMDICERLKYSDPSQQRYNAGLCDIRAAIEMVGIQRGALKADAIERGES